MDLLIATPMVTTFLYIIFVYHRLRYYSIAISNIAISFKQSLYSWSTNPMVSITETNLTIAYLCQCGLAIDPLTSPTTHLALIMRCNNQHFLSFNFIIMWKWLNFRFYKFFGCLFKSFGCWIEWFEIRDAVALNITLKVSE